MVLYKVSSVVWVSKHLYTDTSILMPKALIINWDLRVFC